MAIPFFPYRLFFLYIEPLAAIGGAYYAGLLPETYFADIIPNSPTPPSIFSTPARITLYQLANLYLLFALNEHLVLSSTDNIRTWKRLLFCLLIADLGHLLSLYPLGIDAYWKVWEWNAMMWGSVGFVYMGAATRLAFLSGLGLSEGHRVKKS